MSKPKKIKDTVRLSVVLSIAQVDRVQQRAIQMSMQEGRQITVSKAVRMAIEAVYLLPKQLDLF